PIVTVATASTAIPSGRPVFASRPDGMSTATTGDQRLSKVFIWRISSFSSPTTGRERPVPKSASITQVIGRCLKRPAKWISTSCISSRVTYLMRSGFGVLLLPVGILHAVPVLPLLAAQVLLAREDVERLHPHLHRVPARRLDHPHQVRDRVGVEQVADRPNH